MNGYLAIEIKRMLRTPRFLIFAVALPVGLYLLECMLYGKKAEIPGAHGITYDAWLMCGLAAYSAFASSMHTTAHVSEEKAIGWNRQLRLTPLRPSTYLLTKVLVAMVVALPGPIAVALTGRFVQGVELSAAGWAQVTLGIWIAALPFAVLGLVVGLLVGSAQQQMYLQGLVMFFGFLGGLLIPSEGFPEWLKQSVKALPSYWLADVGHGALTKATSTVNAVLVLAAWTVALGAIVVATYRREAARA